MDQIITLCKKTAGTLIGLVKPVSWAIYKSSVEFIRKGRVLVCWQPVWPRVASHRGTWSQGCYQSGKTCQCYWGLDLWEYCWLSASGSHAVSCKVRLVHLIPLATLATCTHPLAGGRLLGSLSCMLPFPGERSMFFCLPWAHLCSGSCPGGAGNGCHTSGGAMREGRTHTRPGDQPKKHLAKPMTRAVFPQSTEGKERRKGLRWPQWSWKGRWQLWPWIWIFFSAKGGLRGWEF